MSMSINPEFIRVYRDRITGTKVKLEGDYCEFCGNTKKSHNVLCQKHVDAILDMKIE